MPLTLSIADREQVCEWWRAKSTPENVALRCRIVLAASKGQKDVEIAAQNRANRHTVELWRKRVASEGIGCLWEFASGRGRPLKYDLAKRKVIVEATLHTKPKGAKRWTARSLAEAQGVSKSTVGRVWERNNVKPDLIPGKDTHDPQSVERFTDIVGMYLNPPQRAMVLCVADDNLLRSLDRKRPGLKSDRRRRGNTNGGQFNTTTILFAKLRELEGEVVVQHLVWNRRTEFLAFLRRLDREFPEELTLHLLMDSYGTHKAAGVRAWLTHHPRFVCRPILTGTNWAGMMERWLRSLPRKELHRGAFVNTPELIRAVDEHVISHGEEPKPFAWIAKAKGTVVAIDPKQRERLEALARSGETPHKIALRARIVLLASQGASTQDIARQMNLTRARLEAHTVALQKKLQLKSLDELIRHSVTWGKSGGK